MLQSVMSIWGRIPRGDQGAVTEPIPGEVNDGWPVAITGEVDEEPKEVA